jgi:gliding motility-associated-like protein
MKIKYLVLIFFCQFYANSQTGNVAPVLIATGNQLFCSGSSIKIVTNMTITDPDDTGISAMYIQISSGYVSGQDILTLTGLHPTIVSSWDTLTGKLTLRGATAIEPTYIELIAAIKDIEYSIISGIPSGSKTFSITIGQSNFLPSNRHYYEYVPNFGVTWLNAKVLAQASTYYGLQGYLATITAADESQIVGAQAAGTGWIGGSDEEIEGTFKWMTGPETGNVFSYTFWNTGEPNNFGGAENYVHITAPGVGILGSWNDLKVAGDPTGPYQPKGYIVEYGGMPGDPVLQIATSTRITIPAITGTTAATGCQNSSVSLQATSNSGVVNWYLNPVGGAPVFTGNTFNTPILSANANYYVDAIPVGGCPGTSRTLVLATINSNPNLIINPVSPICSGSTATLTANTTSGTIFWYDSPTSTTAIGNGLSFVTPTLQNNETFYAQANNNGCLSPRLAVSVIVNLLPNISDENIEKCKTDRFFLDAGITGMRYLWNTGEISQTIAYGGLSQYSVVITNPANCSKVKKFNITIHDFPTISKVMIDNNNATIIMSNTGDFEYSIDGINFQNSNIFNIVEGGIYTAVVKEIHGCGIDTKRFGILNFPKFFTPNNDGNNDYWLIKGLTFYPKARVEIFDRFSKLIAVLTARKPTWNGTFNNMDIPADDYWFVSKIDDSTPEESGHFALVR